MQATVARYAGDGEPFLQIGSNFSSSTCSLAQPNVLDFSGSDLGEGLVLQIWSYPQDAGSSISLKTCVVAFFALSCIFQATVSLAIYFPKFFRYSGYGSIFDSKESRDPRYSEAVQERGTTSEQQSDAANLWFSQILAFNVLRFIEYTFSGSLVLVTVALVAGIADVELIMCIFLLSGACMLLGLVAEYGMRGCTVLQKLSLKIDKLLPADDGNRRFKACVRHTIEVIAGQLRHVFWISHILGWLCIALPWYIIFRRYMSWWAQCTGREAGGGGGGSQRKAEPPDFVMAIVWIEVILYCSFGVVQLLQYFWPHKRRSAEIAYISLSFAAKMLLGIILAASVFM